MVRKSAIAGELAGSLSLSGATRESIKTIRLRKKERARIILRNARRAIMQAASRGSQPRQVRPVLIAIESRGDFETSRFGRSGFPILEREKNDGQGEERGRKRERERNKF